MLPIGVGFREDRLTLQDCNHVFESSLSLLYSNVVLFSKARLFRKVSQCSRSAPFL